MMRIKSFRHFLAFVCLWGLSAVTLPAQLESDSLTTVFFEQLYAFSFEDAQETLNRYDQRKNKLAHHIAGANYFWWSIITGQRDKNQVRSFNKHNTSLIKLLKDREPSSLNTEEVFALIHSHAYQTRLHLMKRQYYQGFAHLIDISPYLDIVLKNPEKSDGFRFLAGLYHSMAAAAIEKRPIYKPFFPDKLVPEADLGYALLLKSAYSDNPMIRTEARYFLMKISLEISENFPEAQKWNRLLAERYPNNMLYPYYAGLIANAMNRSSDLRKAKAQLSQLGRTLTQITMIQRSFLISELNSKTK